MPEVSLTTPLMAPETCIAVAAGASDGAARHATPNNREANVLCVFVFNIDALVPLQGMALYAFRLP
jgi:hypothetical protein